MPVATASARDFVSVVRASMTSFSKVLLTSAPSRLIVLTASAYLRCWVAEAIATSWTKSLLASAMACLLALVASALRPV